MEDLLEVDWYFQSPIDFEHKQYKLFSYLQKCDSAFYERIFSPYLLHTEKIVAEMESTLQNIKNFEKGVTKKSLFFSLEGVYIKEEGIPKMEEIQIVEEVIEFSLPLLFQRIELGSKLFKKYPRILY
jgi:hypothetical protein